MVLSWKEKPEKKFSYMFASHKKNVNYNAEFF